MTIEERATAYAERYEARPMAETAIRAYINGATEALASQWRSVEEELPEPDTMCLVFGYQDLDFNGGLNLYTMMAWYDGEDFYDAYNDRKYHPVKWMAIPLPDINTEKK